VFDTSLYTDPCCYCSCHFSRPHSVPLPANCDQLDASLVNVPLPLALALNPPAAKQLPEYSQETLQLPTDFENFALQQDLIDINPLFFEPGFFGTENITSLNLSDGSELGSDYNSGGGQPFLVDSPATPDCWLAEFLQLETSDEIQPSKLLEDMSPRIDNVRAPKRHAEESSLESLERNSKQHKTFHRHTCGWERCDASFGELFELR